MKHIARETSSPKAWIIRQRRPNILLLETLCLFEKHCIDDFVSNGGYSSWKEIDDMFECVQVEIKQV